MWSVQTAAGGSCGQQVLVQGNQVKALVKILGKWKPRISYEHIQLQSHMVYQQGLWKLKIT